MMEFKPGVGTGPAAPLTFPTEQLDSGSLLTDTPDLGIAAIAPRPGSTLHLFDRFPAYRAVHNGAPLWI